MRKRKETSFCFTTLIGSFALLAAGFLAPASGGYAGRADAPPKPDKGEYKWESPKKGWTPPTRKELEGWKWADGPIVTGHELGAKRFAGKKPPLTVDQALELKNDSRAANERILATLGMPPASAEQVDWDATFNRISPGAPSTLNPLLQSSMYEMDILDLLSSNPFLFDWDFKAYGNGEFIVSWRRNPMAEMVLLRDDLYWEDGTPLTAYDIEFSYHAIMDDRISIPSVRSGTDELKWVKAYDAQTLVFFHKEPLVTNVWNCLFPIIPKHIYSSGLTADPTMRASEWNVYWNLHPLSSGPYALTKHETKQYLILERRENWYVKDGKQTRAKPYIKRLRFRIIEDTNSALLAFKKGDLDEMRLLTRQWVKETDDAKFKAHGIKVNGVNWGYSYIGWNQRPIPDAPFFKDRRVRLAMTYAMNYEELLQEIYFGLYDPGAGNFHPTSWMASPNVKPFEQDLDKAEELLEEAGWADSDNDGIRDKTIDGKKWSFHFTMSVPQGGTGDRVAILLKEDLESIGIKMEIKMLEWATYQQQTYEHRFQASTAAWGTGVDPDTSKNLWQTKMYDQGRNYVGYSNPEVDELFEKGAREFDFEKRRKIYQRIHELIAQDQPYTFLLFRRDFWAFSKRVRGFAFSPRNPFGYSPGFSALWIPKTGS